MGAFRGAGPSGSSSMGHYIPNDIECNTIPTPTPVPTTKCQRRNVGSKKMCGTWDNSGAFEQQNCHKCKCHSFVGPTPAFIVRFPDEHSEAQFSCGFLTCGEKCRKFAGQSNTSPGHWGTRYIVFELPGPASAWLQDGILRY